MTVGLVAVSHSHALAEAAVALAAEMVQGAGVALVTAGGLDERAFGTDAVRIEQAITEADRGDGVVVLMDLGSAVLSAELALELLDDAVRERVLLCPAPLVEGLVVAAVAAAGGADRQAVADEATGALAGKLAQLTPAGAPPAPSAMPQEAEGSGAGMGLSGAGPATPSAGQPGAEWLSGVFTVTNPHGLHARPASRLVLALRGFEVHAELRNRTTGSAWVPAGSLSRIAGLGVLAGHEVELRVQGGRAEDALANITGLAEREFDEDTAVADPAAPRTGSSPATAGRPTEGPGGVGQGGVGSGAVGSGAEGRGGQGGGGPIGASPGVAVGPARFAKRAPVELPETTAENPDREWHQLRVAIETARRDIERVRARTEHDLGAAQAAIFDAPLLLLDDPDLLDQVRVGLDGGQSAGSAWAGAVHEVGQRLAALSDEYQRARAADVEAVGYQVLRALLGAASVDRPIDGVLVAPDLVPAEAAELDPARILAVVLAFGSPASHAAILLRAKGIPAVVGAGASVLNLAEGTPLAVDGERGELVVNPSVSVHQLYRERAVELAHRRELARRDARLPATTADGVQIHVGANIGSVADARAAGELGADLAGLVRTEFLFLGRRRAPDVAEQEAVYREIAAGLGGRRITLRTLDVGGDKPLEYLPMPAEANPYLGVRGIRLSLANPKLLTDQLLAIVRVAHETPVSVMFPMVATLAELLAARRLLAEVIAAEGRGEPDGLRVGMMVEVPAAALKAAVFAPHVDFFSIGTNDLTQYALAADRGNDAVAAVGDPFDPGLLRLIEATCRGASSRATVAVCGELAADERAAALLLGLGVRELSVTPRAIPTTKLTVRSVELSAATPLAAGALTQPTPEAVRALLAR